MRSVCKTLVGKPEQKRTFGRPRHKWEDITAGLMETLIGVKLL
jgi:hypothetical protein